MKRWGWPLILALVGALTGLSMVAVALERTVIAANADGPGARPATSVYIQLFVGLFLIGHAALWSHTVWVRYLVEHPETKQIPAAVLAIVGGVAAVILVVGTMSHAVFVASATVPQISVNPGVVAFQVVFATVVLASGVLGWTRKGTALRFAATP